jgi:hypothetical protein
MPTLALSAEKELSNPIAPDFLPILANADRRPARAILGQCFDRGGDPRLKAILAPKHHGMLFRAVKVFDSLPVGAGLLN